jgi:protein gp37
MTPTTIGWADVVWNPVAGCGVVSPECRHCYAMTLSRRHKGMALAMTARGEDPGRLRHAPEVIGPGRPRTGRTRSTATRAGGGGRSGGGGAATSKNRTWLTSPVTR